MTPPPSGPANAAGTQRPGRDTGSAGTGVLGARPVAGQTWHGQDPELVAASAICQVSPTRCQARTRLYRDGRLELEGFPVADISDHLADGSVTIWLDLRDPDHDDLAVLSEEFGLHPLAVEDALHHSQRPKLDRYPSHLFLTAYAARLDAATGELATSELAAFVTGQALITVRKDDGLDIGAAVQRWDQNLDLTRFGVGYLLYGLLDYIVDGHFEAVQSLDDCVEGIEDRLFDDIPHSMEVQRRSFQLRKSLVLLRRVVIPMREVVNAVMRRDLHLVLETNVTIQGNRLNIITKKVTGWAAIIAVPTLITGYFGMNVPYPGFSAKAGFTASLTAMILAALVLYIVFKRKDWL
jgi:magnesium transporter